MQADFSRDTFDPAKHFSAVLSQQGRVQLDADANEQAAILLHQLRTAVADIIGPAGTPAVKPGCKPGFEISVTSSNKDLTIEAGRFYVDGILVENDNTTTYLTQPDGHLDPDNPSDKLPDQEPYLVYLRVWERLVTALHDPTIREVALGDPGPDTAVRAKVVWQVATHVVQAITGAKAREEFTSWLNNVKSTGRLRADANRPSSADENPCHISSSARFRGQENQLYRVEIHAGGVAAPTDSSATHGQSRKSTGIDHGAGATFKWSRENASVVFPIKSISGAMIELSALDRDNKLDLAVGDMVEIVNEPLTMRAADDVVLTHGQRAPTLLTVVAIDAADRAVTLDAEVDCVAGANPLLRRWDHGASPQIAGDGAVPIREGHWLNLEDGVQVYFEKSSEEVANTYRRGDYWLIPARTATGDVLWPQGKDGPMAREPHGVQYHYAPLVLVSNGAVNATLRHVFKPLNS